MKLHKLHISETARRIYRRCFPERQIFLRSGGEVRFLRLSPRMQALAASSAAIAIIWVSAIAYAAFHRDEAVISKERELGYVSQELDKLLTEMNRIQTGAINRARLLEQRQQLLESAAGLTVDEAGNAGDEGAAARVGPSDETTMDDTESARGQPASQAYARPPASSPSLLSDLIGSRQAQAGDIPGSARMSMNVDAIIARLDRIAQRQEASARALSNEHRKQIEAGRTILATLRLPVDSWLNETTATAAGGPYVPDSVADSASGPFADLARDMDMMQQLDAIFRTLPSVKPAEKYYISSRFGYRRDPFTKQRAKHSGVDLAGWRGEPILAAADGKVVKAGRYPAYGNMVEIDHGNGIRTRYGHMRRVTVKSGQIVDVREKIGEMGSTGRSTSTHLHWEVWVNGKVVDPFPYLKAINDVQDFKGRLAQIR